MGQKVNPIGLRVGVNKDWSASWFANKKEFGVLLNKYDKIRKTLSKKKEMHFNISIFQPFWDCITN